MKHSIFLSLLFLLLAPTACQQEKAAGVDLDALKQSLNADPAFEATKNMFREHTRLLASLTPNELKAVHDKTHQCGFYASDASLPELAECLKDTPKGSIYVECQKWYRDFEKGLIHLEKKYEDLAQLSPIQKGYLFAGGPEHAMKILSEKYNIDNHEN